jgi:nucleotide-binding universal stress UspA family protein
VSGQCRVIVGTSGSPGSIPALRQAGRIARRDGALLVVVHAWVPPGGDLAERRYPSPYLRKIWAEAAGDRLQEACDTAWGGAPDAVEVQRIVMRGEPGPALVDLASSAGDLLVVGTGRRGLLGRAWHGHVSRYCLARSRCPVLAVPPADGTRKDARGLGTWSLRHRELTVDQAVHEWQSASVGHDQG